MEQNEGNKTPLMDLGKYGLIDQLAGKVNNVQESTVAGIGDDAAVIDSGGHFTLVSTDLLLEGIHFNLVYSPLRHLGYKAVIRAISDIYAMNGTPHQVFLALGISSRFYVEHIEELFDGAVLACKKYNIDIAGGDTTSSLTGLTIAVTAVGTVEKDKVVRRSGAKANDLICVTGDLGAAYTGLQLLERERRIFEKERDAVPDFGGYDYVIGRQLKPEIPADVLRELNKTGIKPSAMIDITEGLASDLMQITSASHKGCRIFNKNIPIDYETSKLAEEFNLDPLIPALNGGDDFELLFTVPLEMYDKMGEFNRVKIIGHITEEGSGNFIVGADGSEVVLTAQGWKK